MIKNNKSPKFFKTAALVIILAFVMVGAGSSSFVSQPLAQAASATPNVDRCKKNFFGLVPWYKYMDGEFRSRTAPRDSRADPCSVKCFNIFNKSQPNDCGQKKSDVPGVLLAIVDNLLRIAGIVAIAYVLVGAFQFVTSQGNPEDAATARSTIINALIGLATAMVAIAFISFIGSRLV